jgi:hypothetical protein
MAIAALDEAGAGGAFAVESGELGLSVIEHDAGQAQSRRHVVEALSQRKRRHERHDAADGQRRDAQHRVAHNRAAHKRRGAALAAAPDRQLQRRLGQ